MIAYLSHKLRLWFATRKLDKTLADYDARIAAARARHEPVAHLQGQKRRFVHEALQGRV